MHQRERRLLLAFPSEKPLAATLLSTPRSPRRQAACLLDPDATPPTQPPTPQKLPSDCRLHGGLTHQTRSLHPIQAGSFLADSEGCGNRTWRGCSYRSLPYAMPTAMRVCASEICEHLTCGPLADARACRRPLRPVHAKTDMVLVRGKGALLPESQQGNPGIFPPAQAFLDAFADGRRDFSGTSWTNVSFGQASLVECNLERAVFDGCILALADFSRSNLRESRFHKCNAIRCSFQECDLTDADFEPSALAEADFFKADLTRANLSNCNAGESFLMQAKLVETKLSLTVFTGAVFGATTIKNVHLLTTELSDIQHALPSYIDGATIDNVRDDLLTARLLGQATEEAGRSKIGVDKLAEIERQINKIMAGIRQFLLRAGSSKDDLERIDAVTPSLAEDFASVFISYSSRDEEFARYLYNQLTLYGISVWFAPNSMRGGKKIHEQVERAIGDQDKLILVLSDASLKSNWVSTEIITAFSREERQAPQVFYPIRIVEFDTIRAWTLFDADSGLDIAKRVREYYIPDFSEWENPLNIAEQLSRLVEDLRRQ